MAEEEKPIAVSAVKEEGEPPAASPPPEVRLKELEEALTQARSALEAEQLQSAELKQHLSSAVAKYRVAVLAGSPELPEEMIGGETAEAVEASVASARRLVEKIQRKLEARATLERVPTGAPVRRGPDLSALSPQEKIAYGLNRQPS